MELNPNLSQRAREDLKLLERARNGDQKAFAELLSKYRDSINYMVLKMVHNRDDADDITIEAFGKAFSNLDKYTPDYAFSTWLYKIATNNTIDFIRRKRFQTLSLDYENEDNLNLSEIVKADIADPEEKFIKHQRAIILREIIEKLNPKYGKLIQLRYFDELSYEEIAQELNIPLGTVKAQLFRAKNLLYNILKNTKGRY
ncbi:MAG: sigma-70 family RNA polymerase sigma factor [Bacteroidetes bacterium]|nr:sigma-70 family RNA polymerase sigma factor [Bacteroidota bacterium]MBK7110510.1 sigma-70 family RNA polymerase sigma factor [Bacteroidota bacterium]MBK8488262.1 sigma-70 family RNA polymerase sigma factor [Bacteroidota bacterium]MBK8681976.1 sigma-70 family RNA polymerase sigma factor [Bacteroidota bacterium]MBP9188823.1 sigma-70 family RNA polymerase sigma factor [Chitinophagales bacterium]